MHTVELLEEAVELAKRCGFTVREESLGGAAAGACQFKGRRWIFVDLALSPQERFDEVISALRSIPIFPDASLSPELQRILKPHRAA